MKTIKRIGFLVAFLLPCSVFAVPYYYGQLEGGIDLAKIGKTNTFPVYNAPAYSDSYVNTNNTSGAFSYGLQTGLGIKKKKAFFEFGVGGFGSLDHSAKGEIYIAAKDPANHWYNYKYKTQIFRLMGIVRVLYAITPRFLPFFSVGLGHAWVDVRQWKVSETKQAFGSLGLTFKNRNNGAFAWQIGGGLMVHVYKKIGVLLGYRFAGVGDAKIIGRPDTEFDTIKHLKLGSTGIHTIYLGVHVAA